MKSNTKESPVIYISRADWRAIVTAQVGDDEALIDKAMAYPHKKFDGSPVILDESLRPGEMFLFGFNGSGLATEQRLKVAIRGAV